LAPGHDLDCPTGANGGFESKGLFGKLSSPTGPPDPESRNPAIWEDHGAPKEDRRGGSIENTNTAAAQNIQARNCENCGPEKQDEELLEAARRVANAKLLEYRRQCWRLAILAKRSTVDKAAAVDRLWEIAVAHALVRALGEDRIEASICGSPAGGRRMTWDSEAWKKSARDHEREREIRALSRNTFPHINHAARPPISIVPPDDPLPSLPFIDMSSWDSEPIPERKWAIRDRVPLNQAGLFSGEGGAGKSIIELTKNVAHVIGRDWLGSLPEPGPALYIGAEDDKDEIHIRLAAIASHYGVTFKQLVAGGLHVLCLLGQDATLCAVSGKSGKVEVTDLYRRLYQAAADIKPINISIDTLSRAFAGSEIDRVQVYGFANHMQALAMAAGGSVTVLSHPSLSGIASGSGISGSTAWHGAFRFRQYLKGIKPEDGEQPDTDLRELEFKKNQYGPTSESIALRYQNGLFLPLPGMATLDKLAQEAKADEIFIDLLRRFAKENRQVSDKKSSAYAPAVFCKEDAAKKAGITSAGFAAAMRRLFQAGKIWNEPCGRPSRPTFRIALKP
jgi:RecA-family ATPase